MVEGLIGKKIGMTQIYREDGVVIPVTAVELGPCVVIQKKTMQREGYEALQLGLVEKRPSRKINRPMAGHFNRAGASPTRVLKEFKSLGSMDDIKVGQEITAESVFQVNEKVNVTGQSKGKGFQGVMKRHGHHGGRASHGSMFHRAPGSIGASATPSRVLKGQAMPGQDGNRQVTVCNLEVVKIMPGKNVVLLKGAVPGHNGSLVLVKKK